MEVIGIIVGVIFRVLLMIIAVVLLMVGLKNKSIKTTLIGILFFFPMFYFSIYLARDLFLPMPIKSEIIGKYQETSWDWFVDKPILTLNAQGEFSFDKPFLDLCLNGEYSYNPDLNDKSNTNVLDFTCGKGFRVVQINKTWFSHEIIFKTNSEGDGITFEKIE